MIFLKARAKINWSLDVLGRRGDGYHLLDMLMQSVELHDTLWMEPSDTVTLEAASDENGGLSRAMYADTMSAQAVRYDDSNLVIKAAKALKERYGITKGAQIRLLKRIPSGAGMGGGSADAAAVLVGLCRLWELELSMDELCTIGLTIGADVPFMLTGGLARVGGVGESIMPISPAPRYWLVVIQPCDGLSTREVFGAFDSLSPQEICHPQAGLAQQALLSGELPLLRQSMGNSLQAVSVSSRPQISAAIEALVHEGAACAMMTGSGSAVYGVFARREDAEAAWLRLKPRYATCIFTNSTDVGVSVG